MSKSTIPAVVPCFITPVLGRDINSQAQLGAARPERCAVVKSKVESQHTTVRADSSATRGYADEFVATNKILLLPETTARAEDLLVLFQGTPAEVQIRIKALMPRLSVWGHLDHFEVSGEIWA